MDGLRRGPTFLSLPAELRLQIYSHALPRPHQGEEYLRIRPTGNFFDYDYGAKCKITIRSVLRTCRAIHAEFSEFLYQCIKFNIIDNVAQDELWLKQYICVVRHLEIKVMSCYQLERCHLRPIFHTIAEGQQKNIGNPLIGSGVKESVYSIRYISVNPGCEIAQAPCTVRGLQKLDIPGLETETKEDLLERLRDRVMGDIVTKSQRDTPFA
ncbi:MAG: hypothetical protein M1813_005735 [Trichoglossum hirsutum]|nr:MAG: hypothetical protein M1813_005735 [Trichoglossum hirsutum]